LQVTTCRNEQSDVTSVVTIMRINYRQRPEKRIFITLERQGDVVSGSLLFHEKKKAYQLNNLELLPTSHLVIDGRPVTLQDVVGTFLQFKLTATDLITSERGQFEVGCYLFSQIFAVLSDTERRIVIEERVDARIVTEDEHLMHLPWSLLAAGEVFLCARGWSVSLSAALDQCADCTLSPSPKILIIAPEAPNWDPTLPEPHIKELEGLLSRVNPVHKLGKNLRWVSTWEEMLSELDTFQPDVLYYYGHGAGDARSSELLFTSKPRDGSHSDGMPVTEKVISAAEFASVLRGLGKNGPRLAYINCCLGDAGGRLGVGRQLSSCVPAVVTNFTTAYRESAQKQALAFWVSTLIEGASPHEAIAGIRAKSVGDLNLSYSDPRWLTPALHSSYVKWNCRSSVSSPPDDLHWRFHLNRIHQFGQVLYQTKRLLQGRSRRSLAYMWYGLEGQGIQHFYERIEKELPAYLLDVYLSPVRPKWPDHYSPFHDSVGQMLADAFNVGKFEEVRPKINYIYADHGKRPLLLFIEHPPIEAEMNFKPERLLHYLAWLDKCLVNNLTKNVYALIGLSFIGREPKDLRREILDQLTLSDTEFDHIDFHLLEEMKALERRDLIEFLRGLDNRWPTSRREGILSGIISRTGGVYDRVLEELEPMISQNRIWDLEEE
jgi:hypothetical protein